MLIQETNMIGRWKFLITFIHNLQPLCGSEKYLIKKKPNISPKYVDLKWNESSDKWQSVKYDVFV